MVNNPICGELLTISGGVQLSMSLLVAFSGMIGEYMFLLVETFPAINGVPIYLLVEAFSGISGVSMVLLVKTFTDINGVSMEKPLQYLMTL